MTQSERFAGKAIIGTGSSAGVGEDIARRLPAEGGNVVINARNAEKCAAVAATLDAARTLVVSGDVSKSALAQEIVGAAVERFGGLGRDSLLPVYNASRGGDESHAGARASAWRHGDPGQCD